LGRRGSTEPEDAAELDVADPELAGEAEPEGVDAGQDAHRVHDESRTDRGLGRAVPGP
jgi:hypothetical protein